MRSPFLSLTTGLPDRTSAVARGRKHMRIVSGPFSLRRRAERQRRHSDMRATTRRLAGCEINANQSLTNETSK